MNTKTRRRIEMGQRSLDLSTAAPDTSPGYIAALERLGDLLKRADTLAAQQREGILEVRTATARKRDLRRMMLRAHLSHLAGVAKIASDEDPELATTIVVSQKALPYLVFRNTARSLQAEVVSRKDLLVKHGLADTVLDSLATALDQFDAAINQSTDGRRKHVGASAELDSVADEIVQIVKILDGLNRLRFANDAERMAAWESASNVFGGARSAAKAGPGDPPAPGGEVKPAA
jgi:hypothetical protein